MKKKANEKGSTIFEYALIAVIISIAALLILKNIGSTTEDKIYSANKAWQE